ncbi:hypothetical protein TYRP_015000 [Tyrophagus putrescentiae]|nr:hypothetical protein TYRP_015000 [Tyrophagus putrescentiae]
MADSLCAVAAIQRPERCHRRAPPPVCSQPAPQQQHTLISPSSSAASNFGGSLVSGRISDDDHHHHSEEELQRTTSESTALLPNQSRKQQQHVAHTNESYLVNMTALMAHCSARINHNRTTCQQNEVIALSRGELPPPPPPSQLQQQQPVNHQSHLTSPGRFCERQGPVQQQQQQQYPRKISTLSQTKALMKIRSRRRQKSSSSVEDTSRVHHLLPHGPLSWSALEPNLANVNFIIVALFLLFTVHFLLPIVSAQRIHQGQTQEKS